MNLYYNVYFLSYLINLLKSDNKFHKNEINRDKVVHHLNLRIFARARTCLLIPLLRKADVYIFVILKTRRVIIFKMKIKYLDSLIVKSFALTQKYICFNISNEIRNTFLQNTRTYWDNIWTICNRNHFRCYAARSIHKLLCKIGSR